MFFRLVDVVVNQVRDMRIVGLLLENEIIFRDGAWCLLGRVVRALGQRLFLIANR
jgi:hypothetical protein